MHKALHWATFLAALSVVIAILVYPSFGQQSVVPMTVKPVPPPKIAFFIFPPEEFDHDYEGDLTIKIVNTLEELRAECRQNNAMMLACSWRNSRSCIMVMVKDEVMLERG